MATNRTPNYNLPQWILADPFLMSEFNNAFQDVDTALKSVSDLLESKPKLATGTYTGTGVYGNNHMNTLHFDFVPKLLFISKTEYSVNSNDRFSGMVFGAGDYFTLLPYATLLLHDEDGRKHTSMTLNFKVNNGTDTASTATYTLSDGGKTLNWYTGGAGSQLNESGKLYYWIAIG